MDSSGLLSLISRPTLYGTYRATSLGCNDWDKLIGTEDSLQLNCSKEGFNAVSTASDNSKTILAHVTPELGLVLEDILITPLRVETQQLIPQIMVTMHQSYGIYFGAVNSSNPCMTSENSLRMWEVR